MGAPRALEHRDVPQPGVRLEQKREGHLRSGRREAHVAFRKEVVSLAAFTLLVSAGVFSPRGVAAAPGAGGPAIEAIARKLADPATQKDAVEGLRGMSD